MQKAWTPPVRVGVRRRHAARPVLDPQAYRLTTLNQQASRIDIEVGTLLVLNLALLVSCRRALHRSIFRLARRFRLDADRWLRALAVHARGALLFSFVHLSACSRVRVAALAGHAARCPTATGRRIAQRRSYLTQPRLGADDLRGDRRRELRARLLPRVQARALKEAQLETRLMRRG